MDNKKSFGMDVHKEAISIDEERSVSVVLSSAKPREPASLFVTGSDQRS